MFIPTIIFSLLAAASLADGAAVGNGVEGRQQADSTCLAANALQTASAFTGLEAGTPGIRDGLSPSDKNSANFINFCSGRTLTNGKQATSGSCNGVPMGRIPAIANMISAIITHPAPGDKLPAEKSFNVTLRTSHLHAGYLVNPSASYYTAPQDLDEKGDVIGHCHVTIQSLGDSMKPSTPLDPSKFVFFKGIDDAGDGRGALQTTVQGGLPPGKYRVCTMIAARNHQPVVMPVAQRGAQDDCTKFEVVARPRCRKEKGA